MSKEDLVFILVGLLKNISIGFGSGGAGAVADLVASTTFSITELAFSATLCATYPPTVLTAPASCWIFSAV